MHHLLHVDAQVLLDESGDQVLAERLLARETGDLGRLVVPLVHEPVSVDAEDGRVSRVDELAQLACDGGDLDLARLGLGEVLRDADDTHNLALGVAPGRRVYHEHYQAFGLGAELELEGG